MNSRSETKEIGEAKENTDLLLRQWPLFENTLVALVPLPGLPSTERRGEEEISDSSLLPFVIFRRFMPADS